MRNLLTPERAYIFRITHRDNLAWILDHGLHCRNARIRDPNYVSIGNPDLIEKRNHRIIDVPPEGTLSDYVPFYFTPLSPMLFNIKTGHNGIKRRENEEILMLVSSLPKLVKDAIRFLFSDRHAYLAAACFSDDLRDLHRIDWHILQNRDFRRDNDDLEKVERYQAEALVYRHLPRASLLGIACYNNSTLDAINGQLQRASVELKVACKPGWYFR